MMSKKDFATIIINRFSIIKSSRAVYNQKFHEGINIIRGANSVGKSTIMDLLFNCLGGDIAQDRWNKEAKACDSLIAEVEINGRVFTLSRNVDPVGKSPMNIYDGNYEKAMIDVEGWQRYGIIRTDKKLSFSQQLFELLGWPSAETDDNANLTIHQILRLIYVDQGTPVNKILRAEHSTFDKSSMRQAIGDFLLGLDDLGIYGLKQKLYAAESEFAKIDGQLDSIYRFISPSEGVLRESHLKEEIRQISDALSACIKERDDVILKPDNNLTNDIKIETERLAREIVAAGNEISIRTAKRSELLNEVIESKLFISSIDSRIKSLQESRSAYDFFGEVRFKFCPSCLLPISSPITEHCHLCKVGFDSSSREQSYLAALNELMFQKRESTQVLTEYKTKLIEADNYLNATAQTLRNLKDRHRASLTITSEKIFRLNEVSTQIGSLEERSRNLESKIKLISSVEGLIQRKDELNSKISEINLLISGAKSKTDSRREEVEFRLSQTTKSLLEKDGGFEADFNNPARVLFDFGKDIMLVDGRSKFSASSETILKNSFHLSILLESISDSQMRYPRLLLLDNIEDKGMSPERSQNFQRVLVESLESIVDPFQVIMTTSMIDSELDRSDYCVGPRYDKGMHTLNLS